MKYNGAGKEMIRELIRHQRFFTEVKPSTEYPVKIKRILEKDSDGKILIPGNR